MERMKPFRLSDTLAAIERLAPPEGAAEWDNTGLLIEANTADVRRILLTLDLTAPVAREAIRTKADLIVAYHPPIFSGLRSLTRNDPVAAPLLDLVAHGISVYSPHTALDAAEDGLSDWLCDPFTNATREEDEGSGRLLHLRPAHTLVELSQILQKHLRLPYLRIASPPGRSRKIKTLALCPGAGASVLKELDADAVFTGEMKHHDILAFQKRGVHVLLSEHGHTERPYLRILKKRMLSLLPDGVRVEVSKRDREPLTLVRPHA